MFLVRTCRELGKSNVLVLLSWRGKNSCFSNSKNWSNSNLNTLSINLQYLVGMACEKKSQVKLGSANGVRLVGAIMYYEFKEDYQTVLSAILLRFCL